MFVNLTFDSRGLLLLLLAQPALAGCRSTFEAGGKETDSSTRSMGAGGADGGSAGAAGDNSTGPGVDAGEVSTISGSSSTAGGASTSSGNGTSASTEGAGGSGGAGNSGGAGTSAAGGSAGADSTPTSSGSTGSATPCSDDPCVNGGRCVVVDDGYVCDCLEGFDPPNCSVNIDECANHECQNGSTCIDEIAGYACDCLDGYEGDFCEDEIDECATNPCENGGTCSDELAGFSCSCVDNWGGEACNIKSFEGLGMPAGYSASRAHAVSDDGSTVVGELTGASGARAFRWQAGTLTVLNSNNQVATATAVNANGNLIVGASTFSIQEGAFWQDGTVSTIYSPGSGASIANAVSNDGWLIAGTCQDGFRFACRWTNQIPSGELLSDATEDSEAWDTTADGTIIVGRGGSDPWHAWRWDETSGWVTLAPLPNNNSAFAEVISGDGSIIYGTSQFAGDTEARAVRWVGTSTVAESLGFGARVNATNHDGSVIAGRLFWTANTGPFIWDAANGTRELFQALDDVGTDLSGWTNENVQGISADGRTFVGYATHNGATEAFIARLP